MATAYTEFSCLGTDLLTTLQTAILASSDWARPNAAGKPTLYKATTTRGAQMCIDIADSALSVNLMTMGVFRTHDGTTGVDKATRYLYLKQTTNGTLATNTYRGVVSVGKEHFFLMIEGPRANETGTDNTGYGSSRQYMFITDLVPYFDSTVDPTPCVAIGGSINQNASSGGLTVGNYITAVSRSMSGLSAWSIGKMLTLTFPLHYIQEQVGWQVNGPDGNQYLAPYVYFDDSTGIRGRLSSFFFAGWTLTNMLETPGPTLNALVTYSGKQYKLLAVNKSAAANNVWNQFGATQTNTGSDFQRSPVVAVPYT